MRYRILLFFVSLFFSVAVVLAQTTNCTPEIDTLLDAIQSACDGFGRNEVCYANHRIESEISEGEFSSTGQVIPVANLISLQTSPYIPDSGEWGIALFNLQTNLPDTLPGQLVTMVVYGDTQIEVDEEAPDGYTNPMQSFYLTTGIGALGCEEVPDSGVLIQNATGEQVELFINGFDVSVNSTALFTAGTPQELTVSTLEGNIIIHDGDESVNIPEGFTITVQADDIIVEPSIAPETDIDAIPVDILTSPVPVVVGEITTSIGLYPCSTSGGVDVASGSNLVMRAGWAETTRAELINIMVNHPPVITFDGITLNYGYRTSVQETERDNGYNYAMHWFYEVQTVATGTHTVIWRQVGETVTCEIRAN